MHYYLYEIRNNLNGKIYVGVHKAKKLDDGYMGSGEVIKRALRKHGAENFTKVILETFENAEAMYAREKEVVTDEFLMREDVYNLRRGGLGGFDHINKNGLSGRKKDWSHWNGSPEQREHARKLMKVIKNRHVGSPEQLAEAREKTLTPESREKRKETFKRTGHAKGKANSQFGTMWITNGLENKKVKKDCPFPDGWRKGRVV